MRNLDEVIDQMILKISDTETGLIQELNRIKNSAAYTSPELIHRRWNEVSFVLKEFIITPRKDWQFEVLSIFSTKPVEEIKSFYQEENR
jgi:hypothetical protein